MLGGLRGSGKHALAKELSLRHSFFHFNVDQHKFPRYIRNRSGALVEGKEPVRSDEDWTRLFMRVTDDFPLVSKMYEHIVLNAPFHRAGPREYFFAKARQFFSPAIFVWVESDDESIRLRVKAAHPNKDAAERKLKNIVRRRKEHEQELEAFIEEPFMFINTYPTNESAARLLSAVRGSLLT